MQPDSEYLDKQDVSMEELLNAQLEALLAGRTFDAQPHTHHLDPRLKVQAGDLLRLAERVHSALVLVQPRGAFLRDLKRELVAEGAVVASRGAAAEAEAARHALRLPNIPPRYRVAAGLGGLTIGAGVAVLAAVRILDMRRRGKAQVSLSV